MLPEIPEINRIFLVIEKIEEIKWIIQGMNQCYYIAGILAIGVIVGCIGVYLVKRYGSNERFLGLAGLWEFTNSDPEVVSERNRRFRYEERVL